jgi:hypothetical protein
VMERRGPSVPHRARYLSLINDYGRRSLDAQRDWLAAVERELDRPPDEAEIRHRPAL